MKMTPRAQRYIRWMAELNRIGNVAHRTYIRNRFTWRAFCKGQAPEQYAKELGS